MKTSESKYASCIYFTSNALARKIERLAIDCWKPVALSPSHAYLLMMVIENPGIQPGELSDNLQLMPSTITRLIEKLENKKLVIRINEGKVTNVYPSMQAKKIQPELTQCVQKFYDSYCNILGAHESEKLVNNMHKIADKLED